MFGQINVRDDSTAHLRFSFVDSETEEPVVLRRFYVTVFDIDQQRSENRHTQRPVAVTIFERFRVGKR